MTTEGLAPDRVSDIEAVCTLQYSDAHLYSYTSTARHGQRCVLGHGSRYAINLAAAGMPGLPLAPTAARTPMDVCAVEYDSFGARFVVCEGSLMKNTPQERVLLNEKAIVDRTELKTGDVLTVGRVRFDITINIPDIA